MASEIDSEYGGPIDRDLAERFKELVASCERRRRENQARLAATNLPPRPLIAKLAASELNALSELKRLLRNINDRIVLISNLAHTSDSATAKSEFESRSCAVAQLARKVEKAIEAQSEIALSLRAQHIQVLAASGTEKEVREELKKWTTRTTRFETATKSNGSKTQDEIISNQKFAEDCSAVLKEALEHRFG